jgi:CBS domain containing-hemolysin-like protein
LIEPEEREFTENVLTFGDRRAGEVMVAREKVRFLTTDQSLDEALDEAGKAAHTRFPLSEPDGGLDAVVGVVHVKGLVRATKQGGELRDLARPVLRIPESVLLDDLLDELRRERQHLALVVGDDGTVRGVVTLEDVLEEIVGEIADEFDPEGDGQVAETDGGLVVAGSAPLEVVAGRLGLELDGPHAPTIGGHAVELLGRVPEPGERFEVGGRRAEVLAVDQVRVTRLRFERPDR